jgi:hypothetical protein
MLALVCPEGAARAQDSTAFTEVLIRSTFRIEGSGKSGTVFMMGDPGREGTDARFVMLTAGHVLEDIRDDWATLVLRTRVLGVYRKLPVKIRVRIGGKPLWLKHSDLDLAAMYVSLPPAADIVLASTNLLASDSSLRTFGIGLGYEVFVLGFPYNLESNDAGFPVLRRGYIASFPIYPTSEYKTFFVDLAAFPGNSGGPVFIMPQNPSYGGAVHVGVDIQGG